VIPFDQSSFRMAVGAISAWYILGLIDYFPVRSGSSQMPLCPGFTRLPNLNSAPEVSSVGKPTWELQPRPALVEGHASIMEYELPRNQLAVITG
jgi:hypothetical protein